MKAIAIISLIFSALSIFIPVGGVFISMICSALALISFCKQPTLSGVTFGINIINTAFLSPSLLVSSDSMQANGGKGTEMFFFYLMFHVVLLILAIVIYFVLNKKRDKKKLFKWLGITAIILIVILFITGRNNNSNKQEEKALRKLEKPEEIKLNSNNNNQKITQSENSKKQEISLTENEAKLIELALKDDINVGFSGGKSLFSKKYIFTTSKELQKIYSDNETRGDKTFKNKDIIISGVVDSISSGIGDVPVVYLKTNEMFKKILLKFDRKYQDIAIDLNKNQKVTFYCNGSGVIIGSPTLSQCKPVDVAKNNEFEYQLKLINEIIKRPDLAEKDNIDQIIIISGIKYISDKSNNFSSCKNIDVNCLNKLGAKYKKEQNFNKNLKEKIKSLGFIKITEENKS